MNNVPIFDTGHSGVVGGVYLTEGKRSPNWQFGVLYEGMFNRWVTNLVIRELDYAGVPYYHVSPEYDEVPLTERVRRANAIYSEDPRAYLVSVHANAGGGTGMEVFTSYGNTQSDVLAEHVLLNLDEEFSPQGWRIRADLSDGDLDKEAGFYVVSKTHCPAMLVECGFMDHKRDYALLWSQDFQQALACNLAKSIIEIYRNESATLV